MTSTKPHPRRALESAAASPAVFIVDDDLAIRESLAFLIESVGLAARTFASAQDFLDHYDPAAPGCLLLDIRMPGMTGLQLQAKLNEQRAAIPVILLTGHGDVPMAVRAMNDGAFYFFEKPFNDQALLDQIRRAIDHDGRRRGAAAMAGEVAARLEGLTRREREVLDLVVDGMPNRRMAETLNLSEKTIESHRAGMMRKMKAKNVVDLVHLMEAVRQAAFPAVPPP